MPRERAMELYVEELKKIIETMSYTDNVAEFMGSINELDGVDVEDLEAVAPEAIKKVKSQPNSPFGKICQFVLYCFHSIIFEFTCSILKASRESSPIRASERPLKYRNELDKMNAHGYTNGNYHNGHMSTTEPSDDEYIDTVEVIIVNVTSKNFVRHIYVICHFQCCCQ